MILLITFSDNLSVADFLRSSVYRSLFSSLLQSFAIKQTISYNWSFENLIFDDKFQGYI